MLSLPGSIFKKLTNKKEEKAPAQGITQEAGFEIDAYIQEKQKTIKAKESIVEAKSKTQKQISPTMKKMMERLELEESGTELAKVEELDSIQSEQYSLPVTGEEKI
jgi:hypothetical protein